MDELYDIHLEHLDTADAAVNNVPAGIIDYVHTASLYDLVLKQWQEHLGLQGIRIGIPPEIFQRISLKRNPYHYAAVTGNTALAVLLWSQGFPLGPSIPVAELSASGPVDNVGSVWTKLLEVTPADAALLEGNAEIAIALTLMEQDVPLHWSPAVHKNFPAAFQEQARACMQDLVKSGLLTHLPGPARNNLILCVMESISPWLCLPPNLQLRPGANYLAAVDANLHAAVEQVLADASRSGHACTSSGCGGGSSASGAVGGDLEAGDPGAPVSTLLQPGAVFRILDPGPRCGRLSRVSSWLRQQFVLAGSVAGLLTVALIRHEKDLARLRRKVIHEVRRLVVCRVGPDQVLRLPGMLGADVEVSLTPVA